MAPSGSILFLLSSGNMQNAPVIITSSGVQETQASDPFARYDGRGKYRQVGYGNFSLTASGSVQQGTNEFAIHPNASGLIVFANTLTENVYIEYEGGNSSYYTMTSVDLNPMINGFNSGFISFSNQTTPSLIVVSATNDTLTSDGAQKTNILATVLDANGDGVPNQTLVFNIPGAYISYLTPIGNGVATVVGASGQATQVTNITNPKGQARVSYWPITGQNGTQIVYASLNYAGNPLFGFVFITQAYTLGNPFTLDASQNPHSYYLT